MLISAVIISRNRPALLRAAIDSLAGGSGGGSDPRLEVVVIDDGSDEPLEGAIGSVAAAFPLTVVRQEPAGLNAGRNRGVTTSSGDIVAFLDDDVRVEPDWAHGVASAFEGRDLAAIGGRILADAEAPVPDWVSTQKLTYLSVLDLGTEAGPFPSWAQPIGANFAVRREWLDRVGAFRPDLDRRGASLLSGGDTELVQRIVAHGGTVWYWPQATVHHRVPAERLTRGWFRRRAEAQGTTDVIARYHSRPGLPDLALEAVRPLRAAGIAAKRLAARRDLVDAELWLWSSRGRWRELRRLLRESRSR